MALPDFPPLPTMPPLPDAPPPAPWTAAIFVRANSIFFCRARSHQGPYYLLPGDFVRHDETPELVCLRSAKAALLSAFRELPPRIRQTANPPELVITLGPPIHRAEFDRRTHIYFPAQSNWTSNNDQPPVLPNLPPNPDFWRPYDWIPLADLRSKKISPFDIAACERLFNSAPQFETKPPYQNHKSTRENL